MQQSAVLKDTIIIMNLIALTEDSSTFIWKTRLKRYLSYVLSCSSDETMRGDADAARTARTARQRFALLILKFIEKTGKNVYVIKCKDKEIMTKNLVLCGLGNDDCQFFFSILALLQKQAWTISVK